MGDPIVQPGAGIAPDADKPECPPSPASVIAKRVIFGILAVILLSFVGCSVYKHEQTLPPGMGSVNFSALSQETANNPKELVQRISDDALWFHELWIRWLLTDWGLTFFAAGTAVTAAIKNVYSSKSGVQNNLSGMDLAVAVLAVGAVVASTFQAKLHASELADRYRYGDLKLQDGKAEYLYDLSSGKTPAEAAKSLFETWQDAQKYLEGPFATPKPSGGTATADTKGTVTNPPPRLIKQPILSRERLHPSKCSAARKPLATL